MVFDFPKQEVRRRRRQGNYMAEGALKFSYYGHLWNRVYVTFYISYDAA
jgi:hypothetical protein